MGLSKMQKKDFFAEPFSLDDLKRKCKAQSPNKLRPRRRTTVIF
jgi:hypothetical protein